ncbi:hypothetical protein EGK75_13705 [Neisseria weixii]|uniref:Uncharacterized protein n=1 Tax=Neisseria weixii TaxID=1853276 RepID=A0A3N4MH89_9NEIS|nr:hypothetical protein [Neisseria weixii]RPD83022.1 hypothetical protein EGK74_13780 [Neisseria weixii]RPD83187.1 hypothetical protein EGK75_13705 [Neisseria weixii]
MGYQVGRICYQTEQEATNVLMTQVIPTIDKDGVLHHPVFKGKAWEYNGQIVKPILPQCEFGAYAQAGKEIGIGLVGATAALLVVVIALKTVSMIGRKDEE